MAFIGNTVTSVSFITDSFSGNASTTSFSPLTRAPAGTASIAVFIAGTYQAPSSYTLSGTTITFASPPASGVGNIIVLHLGNGSATQVTSDGSVTLTKLSSDTFGYINAAFTAANSASVYANSAFLKANTPDYVANSAASYANAAFAVANTDVTNISTTAAVYGNATYVPAITLSANGRISSITNTAISLPSTTYSTNSNNSIVTNNTFITGNVTVSPNTGAFSVGPITINNSQSVNVSSNARWVVI